jgi:hypothetical protein
VVPTRKTGQQHDVICRATLAVIALPAAAIPKPGHECWRVPHGRRALSTFSPIANLDIDKPSVFIAALRDPDSTGTPSPGFFAAIRLNLSHKNPVDKKKNILCQGEAWVGRDSR